MKKGTETRSRFRVEIGRAGFSLIALLEFASDFSAFNLVSKNQSELPLGLFVSIHCTKSTVSEVECEELEQTA